MEYIKDKFLTDIKKMNKTNDKYEDKAYESIVKNFYRVKEVKKKQWDQMNMIQNLILN